MIQHNLDTWLSKVLKELPKGTSLQDLEVNNDLFSSSGFENKVNSLQELDSTPTSWKIIAQGHSNHGIIKSLEYGAQGVFIHIKDGDDLSTLFEGIEFDFIDSILVCSDELIYTKAFDMLKAKNHSINLLKSYVHQDPVGYYLVEKPNLKSIVSAFEKLISSIDFTDQKVFFHFQTNKDFYYNVIAIRALRLIFKNITTALDKKNELYIITSPLEINQDPNQNLIEATYHALSAVMGGADYIYNRSWHNDQEQDARLSQNILHLLDTEAKMNEYVDLLKGSYFFENAINMAASRIWNSIINKD
jgi:hypothetical protein